MEQVINDFRGKNFFLSNFFPRNMLWNGVVVPTWEHGYQAEKTLDPAIQATIIAAPTAREAKKLGSSPQKGGIVTLRSDWSEVMDHIMLEGVQAKYNQHDDLKMLLLMTKNKTLIEGNFWHDNYWGDCFCSKCRETPGLNKLGEIHMLLRQQFREGP